MTLDSRKICTTPFSPARGSATGAMLSRGVWSGRSLADFAKREEGAVAVIAGLAIPVLLGFAGLALEYGQNLVVRAEAQRTADLASHAGAVAYARTGSTGPMVDAARGVARLNGFGDDEIVVELDLSFSTASGGAVRATITAPQQLYLPRLVGGDASVDVVASAVAGAMRGAPACIQALDPDGSGINLSGGTSLHADECGVASNAEVTVTCGASIITKALSYDSDKSPVKGNCETITAPDGSTPQIVRRPSSDPLAESNAIQLAREQMSRTAALAPSDGVTVAAGPNVTFGWDQGATMAQAVAVGCSATFASSNSEWTFSCPGQTSVNIGNVLLEGGLRLRFNPGASQGFVYNISGRITNSGAYMDFAGGTYNVAQGIYTGGGATTEFGAGTYRIGRSNQSCNGARYSICNTSKLMFNGPSEFVLPGGVRNEGDAVMTLGTGTGNSFRFGPSSNDDAISMGGGSQLYMGDVDDSVFEHGVFEVAGWIDGGGGNSCLVIPAADLHEINGSIVASGAIRFGAGIYAIDGYMHLGGNGGGSSSCRGEIVSVEAIDTTFLISANGVEPGNWGCRDQSFCVSSDYSNVQFRAPLTGPFADIAIVGPLDASRREGATFRAGASDGVVTGAAYFPNGPITLSGGASASGGDGGCLQIIGAEITLTGGASLASDCEFSGAGTIAQVAILR
ncbi:Putative Flp pilus-assembly TadE/G-like [Salinihabitans flavidus]|uniref:Putative Flp pilus-assembly TadE/G-like n=1 Tax=Salinihabitans flavidus TaxID=569882 RepID=A0A1H8VU28_9RHOB|nr:Tad domain-containing protein [Salinihabitans flavidus]SEP18865.1 Putative Flp pilus-assembly TadE/G-like [Salinihabitans flavidus]